MSFYPSVQANIALASLRGNKRPRFVRGRELRSAELEQIPQELVVNVVVILHLRCFHKCPKLARAAIS